MRIETPSGRIYAEEHGNGHPLRFISGLGGRLGFWSEHALPTGGHFCPRVMAEHYNQKLFQFLSAD